jgi:hypothetical protein
VLGEGQPLIRALGLVFNVATMFEKHPGGPEVLRLYLGRDASQVFARVGHTQDPRVVRLLHKTLVARVVEGQRTVEVQLRQALERVLEVREAFRLESDLLHKALTRAEDPTQLPITQLPITQLPVTQLPSAQPATEQPIAQLPSNLGQWHGQDALVRLRGSLVHWALRDGVLALVHAQCGRFESEQDFHAVRRLEAVLVTLAERPLESNALIALHAALQRLMLATALAVLPVVTDSLEPLPSTEHWNACAERLLVVMGEHAAALEAYPP